MARQKRNHHQELAELELLKEPTAKQRYRKTQLRDYIRRAEERAKEKAFGKSATQVNRDLRQQASYEEYTLHIGGNYFDD